MLQRLHIHKKDRIFYSYLLSYLLISIVSLLFSIVAYINCENILKKEILTSQSYVLKLHQDRFDNYINTVNKINRSLSGNADLLYLMNNAGFSPQNLLDINDLKAQLASAKKSMEFCSDLAIYLHRSDSFITSTKRYPSETGHLYTSQYSMTKDEFRNFISIPESQGYKILRHKDGTYTLFFIQNIYNYNLKFKLATIFTAVPWENIAQSLNTIEHGGFFWITEDNTLLPGPGGQIDLSGIGYHDFSSENQLFELDIKNVAYIGSYKKSELTDIKYCMLISKNSYFSQINYMKMIIGVQVIIVLLVVTALSMYYSLKSYHPISRIINVISRYNKLPDGPVNLEKISNYLEKLVIENNTLANSWKQAKLELSNQVVLGFVRGWNTDIATLREAIIYNNDISFREEPFVVLLASFSDSSNSAIFNHGPQENAGDQVQLMQYVFNDVFTNKVLSHFSGMLCSFGGTYLCLLNVDIDGKDEELLIRCITECVNWYKENLNLKLMVGISSIHTDLSELPKAYNEASQVISYQLFWEATSNPLMFYRDSFSLPVSENDTGNKNMVQFLDNEKKLHNFLTAKEFNKASELLDVILEENFIQDINFMGINKCRMYSLINTIFTSLCDILGKNNEDIVPKLGLVERLLEANSLETVKKVMHEIFDDLVRYVEENLVTEQPRWLNEIVSYVDRNYADPNLNIAAVSDQIGMNLTYVGRTFKKFFGYGLTDYIHMQRLKKCKELLIKGDSVKDAAQAVGYIDSKTLIRIFKKYEGITPGQFRNNCRSSMT